MSTETIEAAINKWSLVAYSLMQSKGRYNCPLCSLYYDDDCKSCPIGVTNHKCEGTPCKGVRSYTYLSNFHDMADAIEQEVIFLCSLLPVEHRWYEIYQNKSIVNYKRIERNMGKKWIWMMRYCKLKGRPPAQKWAWDRAEKAYRKAFP